MVLHMKGNKYRQWIQVNHKDDVQQFNGLIYVGHSRVRKLEDPTAEHMAFSRVIERAKYQIKKYF